MSAQGRQHRKEAKEHSLRQMRALDRELRQLWRRLGEAEPIPLEEPFQRGWVRYFVWSGEAERRKDFDAMQGLLELFQNKQWSRRRDFKHSKRKRRHVVMGWKPSLSFHPHEMLRLCRDARWPSYFQATSLVSLRSLGHLRELHARGWNGKVRFKYPKLLEGRVDPYMVTHQQLHDSETESRIAEIESWIERHGGWDALRRAMGRRSWKWPDDRQKKLRRVDEKEVRGELERRGIIRAFRFTSRALKVHGEPYATSAGWIELLWSRLQRASANLCG